MGKKDTKGHLLYILLTQYNHDRQISRDRKCNMEMTLRAEGKKDPRVVLVGTVTGVLSG